MIFKLLYILILYVDINYRFFKIIMSIFITILYAKIHLLYIFNIFHYLLKISNLNILCNFIYIIIYIIIITHFIYLIIITHF